MASAPQSPSLSPGLTQELLTARPDDPLRVIVAFDDQASLEAFLPRVSDRVGIRTWAVPALAFEASAREVMELSRAPGVRHVELDEPAPLLLPTATTATRAKAVWGHIDGGPILHPVTGEVIDGSGIGVAVVDTGILALHPDLADRVVKNFKVVGTKHLPLVQGPQDLFVEMSDTDTTSGHGTHVASIVAGTGLASDGVARGAAPGASLYGFGTGEGVLIVTSFAAAAFDWVLANHGTVDPPIRVVTNSWGGDGAFDPNELIDRLATRLVQEGIVVVWAAGNGSLLGNGGDGSDDRVNRHAKNPVPGVLGVANYDDANSGTRDGGLAESSSRGAADDPSTWPDLAAPGTGIYAAFNPAGPGVVAEKAVELFDLVHLLHEPGNSLGNAFNQHQGTVVFRLGGQVSASVEIDWILWLQPVVVYNAHRNAFAMGSDDDLHQMDPTEVAAVQFFGPVPSGSPGPVRPVAESARAVAPGDALLLAKGDNGGTGNPIKVQLTSPSGTSKTLTVHFPCQELCAVEVPLAATFGSEPADGTWVLGPGPTPTPERFVDALTTTYGYYVEVSGTSMAAPHVAGVVALTLQADPELTPAQVEDILEDTAYKFAFGAEYAFDPANPDDTSSFDKGHGLLDARAAVEQALARLG